MTAILNLPFLKSDFKLIIDQEKCKISQDPSGRKKCASQRVNAVLLF